MMQQQQQQQQQQQPRTEAQSQTQTQTHAQIRAKDAAETTTTTTQMTAAATIARGAFSETLKGTVDASGETVAIKRFGESRQAKREMRHEVQVLRALARVASAPFACFTVQLRCVDWDANAVGLELCEGGDLFGLLFQNEELSESDILFYAAEVAAAISHLHANGILHGDIKPENIGITAQGHIRLFDFGLSHIFDQENERDPDTGRLITPTNAGTTMYASPELLMLRQTSMDSDWWSYGVLLFEIFFQRLPWLAESDEDTANLICTEPLVWVHDDKDFASADVFDLVEGLLGSKHPRGRLTYKEGFAALQAHPFFTSVDWKRLGEQAYLPPFRLSP